MGSLLRKLRHVLSNGSIFGVWVAAMLGVFMGLTLPLMKLTQRHPDLMSDDVRTGLVLVIFFVSAGASLLPTSWWYGRLTRGDEAAAKSAKALTQRGLIVEEHDGAGLAALVVRLRTGPAAIGASAKAVEHRLEGLAPGYSIGVDDGAFVARFDADTPTRDVESLVERLNNMLSDLPSAEEVEAHAGRLAMAPEQDEAGQLALAAEAGQVAVVKKPS
jgi:hypothetical protein